MLYKGRACLGTPHSPLAQMLPTTALLLGLTGTVLGFHVCQLIADEVSFVTDVYYPGEYYQAISSCSVWLTSGRILVVCSRQ